MGLGPPCRQCDHGAFEHKLDKTQKKALKCTRPGCDCPEWARDFLEYNNVLKELCENLK